MAELNHANVRLTLPAGWEGEIVARPQIHRAASSELLVAAAEAEPLVTVHAANYSLPPARGDYGSGAVEAMPPDGVFVALFEFGPESVGETLFAQQGLPRPLDPAAFSPRQLQRPQRNQGGLQTFCTIGGRAFCLYVVIGNYLRAAELVPVADELLAGLQIGG